MRTLILPISSLFILLALLGCGNKKGSGSSSISGTIEGAEGSTIYFQKMDGREFKFIDSARIEKDGSFRMSNPAGKKDLYFFGFNRSKRMVLITDSTQNIELVVDSSELGRSIDRVEGSKDTRLLYEYYADLFPLKERMDSLQRELRRGGRSQELKQAVQGTQKEVEEMTRSFVKENSNSPAIIPALSSISAKENIDLLRSSYENLKESMGHSPYLSHLGRKVKQVQARKQQANRRQKAQKERNKLLQKGKEAPDISLKTPKGNVKPLSDLEGNVVLIDFWASWCKPCIKTVPKLRKLYDEYSGEGFEIYGVSLDKKKKSWVNAIEKYEMDWVHVSDLKYFNSAAAQKYKIKSIPFTVLVDREGKIIARGLRGQELVQKIEEVMG
jgi:peroxiredoxin